MQTVYEHDGQTIPVTLKQNADGTYTATVGDRAYTVRESQAADGAWLLDLDGRRAQVYTAHDGAQRFAQVVGGDSFALRVAEPRSRRRGGAAGGEGKLTAQMPGQVVDVLVAAGDEVKQGQPLVVLEAMKMEIRATAPKDGTVREVYVKKGDVVERDQPLASVE